MARVHYRLASPELYLSAPSFAQPRNETIGWYKHAELKVLLLFKRGKSTTQIVPSVVYMIYYSIGYDIPAAIELTHRGREEWDSAPCTTYFLHLSPLS